MRNSDCGIINDQMLDIQSSVILTAQVLEIFPEAPTRENRGKTLGGNADFGLRNDKDQTLDD